jgi:hypothetical protein
VLFVWLPGHVTTGAWLSFTVIVNVQRVVSPEPSVACHTTAFAPFWKAEPLARPLYKAAEAPVQLSVDSGVT